MCKRDLPPQAGPKAMHPEGGSSADLCQRKSDRRLPPRAGPRAMPPLWVPPWPSPRRRPARSGRAPWEAAPGRALARRQSPAPSRACHRVPHQSRGPSSAPGPAPTQHAIEPSSTTTRFPPAAPKRRGSDAAVPETSPPTQLTQHYQSFDPKQSVLPGDRLGCPQATFATVFG